KRAPRPIRFGVSCTKRAESRRDNPAVTRRTALDNPRFRGALLVAAGIPISVLYLWRTVVLPLTAGALPGDFSENYMAAAAKIAAGRDPYDVCAVQGCAGGTAQSFVPLPLAGAQY